MYDDCIKIDTDDIKKKKIPGVYLKASHALFSLKIPLRVKRDDKTQ